jgi:thioredoxin-related protein
MNKIIYQILLSIIVCSCGNSLVKETKLENNTTHSNIDFLSQASRVIDLKTVLKESKTQGKPILLYFTSHYCVNARKMEEQVLNDNDVIAEIQGDFIFIPLSVDDRSKLPKNKWLKSKLTGEYLTEIGSRNNELQIETTQSGTQPYFAIINENKDILGTIGFEIEKEKFLHFLNCP